MCPLFDKYHLVGDLDKKISLLSPTRLAFIGDAVFSLHVRERLSLLHDYRTGEMTAKAAKLVSAVAQSKMLDKVLIYFPLTEQEQDLLRRCKNANTNHCAKNASIGDYHKATALEGLIGYLHLVGNDKRVHQIVDLCLDGLV